VRDSHFSGILEVVMKHLDLRISDFPIVIRLILPNGSREYVLIKTKQDRLLLNKIVGSGEIGSKQ
jgi:hypothetical protein